MPETVVEDWYNPGSSIREFHESPAFIRALIGGRGSGKTFGVANECLTHGWKYPGAKIYILRKTLKSQDTSTLDTFKQVFEKWGSAYVDTGLSLFKVSENWSHIRIPSQIAVQRFEQFLASGPRSKTETLQWLASEGERFCSHIHFSGVPDSAKRATRFRGYECSMLVFVEADELEEEDFLMAVPCLRWPDAFGNDIPEKGCILDTNPPSPRHWIARFEYANENDPSIRFWHLRTAENEHNLPPGYVEQLKKTYKNNPAGYQKMVLGQYADTFNGNPVYFAYREDLHARDRIDWPTGAYLIRGWDFGATSNACVFSAYWTDGHHEYWFDMSELILEQSDTERQCRAVIDRTQLEFPFYNDRDVCAGILDFCDPAGAQKKSTGQDLDILRTYNIRPRYSYKLRSLQNGIATVNRLLEATDDQGRYCYQIDKVGCPVLYLGYQGGYRYPTEGEPGFGKNEPGKGPKFGNFDHPHDAARYAKINTLRLIGTGAETVHDAVGALAAKTTINRERRYY